MRPSDGYVQKWLRLPQLPLFLFSAAADAAQTLRVGSLTVYAPFEYVNSQNGEYEGFDMDLIREIGRRKGSMCRLFP